MATTTKQKIISRIRKRFGKKLSPLLIHDAVIVICDMLVDELAANRVVSVHNFGSLSPYEFHGHRGINVATGRVEEVRPFRTVKFRPHVSLKKILSCRREGFK